MAMDNRGLRKLAVEHGNASLREIDSILRMAQFAGHDEMTQALRNAKDALIRHQHVQVLDDRTYTGQARRIAELEDVVCNLNGELGEHLDRESERDDLGYFDPYKKTE